MIISKTPLRISFFGGGSDISQFYMRNNNVGAVLSATIDKTIDVALNICEPQRVRVVYSELEEVSEVSQLSHKLARACLQEYSIDTGVEVVSFSRISTKGSGLGSSSAYTVGLLNCLDKLEDRGRMTTYSLAEKACEIEIDVLKAPIGKQDQYAAAFGGFNFMTFSEQGTTVQPLMLTDTELDKLQNSLFLVNTGLTRSTSIILAGQVSALQAGTDDVELHTRVLSTFAFTAREMLKVKDFDAFGQLLGKAWQTKKKLTGSISNPEIDSLYEYGLNAGAIGGKLLGAGGGGYLLFYVPEKMRSGFRTFMLKQLGPNQIMPVTFSRNGSQVFEL